MQERTRSSSGKEIPVVHASSRFLRNSPTRTLSNRTITLATCATCYILLYMTNVNTLTQWSCSWNTHYICIYALTNSWSLLRLLSDSYCLLSVEDTTNKKGMQFNTKSALTEQKTAHITKLSRMVRRDGTSSDVKSRQFSLKQLHREAHLSHEYHIGNTEIEPRRKPSRVTISTGETPQKECI